MSNWCVTAQNYTSTPNVFCTLNGGTSGSTEPSWNTIAGSTTCDGGGSPPTCSGGIAWVNEGPGIGFNLDMTGTISGNTIGGYTAVGMKLQPNGATGHDSYGSVSVSGNNFYGNLWVDLWDLSNGSSVFSNTFSAPTTPRL